MGMMMRMMMCMSVSMLLLLVLVLLVLLLMMLLLLMLLLLVQWMILHGLRVDTGRRDDNRSSGGIEHNLRTRLILRIDGAIMAAACCIRRGWAIGWRRRLNQ